MKYQPQTWHYGIVAQHWAEFQNYSVDGPEIAYYQKLLKRFGQPALDAGCGTGRMLLPYLRAGLDVDGCDISPDMLAHWNKSLPFSIGPNAGKMGNWLGKKSVH
jgi:SAM-dependent methyltransferase